MNATHSGTEYLRRHAAYGRQVSNATAETKRRQDARRRGYHSRVFTRNDLAAAVARNNAAN